MTAPTPVDIRQILFATDFSAHSEHAFRAALALAQHFGARLRLIHVVHRPQEQEAARARLQAFAEERLGAEPFTVAVAVGTAAPEIVRYADREKADLIVMGTHGRTGLAHVLLGSVAETVVRHASCQVLTIRRPAEVALKAPAPSPESLEEPSAPPGPAYRCLVCVQPAEDLICETCKGRIRAEVLHRKLEDEKAGR